MSTYREESLPETLQDMSDRFGKPFVRHMIERFAGITLIIPAKSRKTRLARELVRLLRQDALSDFRTPMAVRESISPLCAGRRSAHGTWTSTPGATSWLARG